MRNKSIISVLSSILFLSFIISGQPVVINNPSEWVTLREKKVVLNTLIDTSDLESKKVAFNLYKNGTKKIAGKVISAESYSQEIELASLNDDVIGGSDYLSIKWDIPGSKKNGVIRPIGVVAKEAINDNDLTAKGLDNGVSIDNISKALSGSNTVKIKNNSIAAGWNSSRCAFLIGRDEQVSEILICIDPKNGKNAFVSYADRFISLINESDSIKTAYYKRGISDNKIEYKEKKWYQDIKYKFDENEIAITLPWYDLGMKADMERRLGLAIIIKDGNGSVLSSYPEGADAMVPGTWANLKLGK